MESGNIKLITVGKKYEEELNDDRLGNDNKIWSV
jgi:hypothetical protein